MLTKCYQLGEIQSFGQPSATSTASLIQPTAQFWTDLARSKAGGGIALTELCHSIQKGTSGISKLHFIMVSQHSRCSFLRASFFFFFCQGEGDNVGFVWRVLNPVIFQHCVSLSGYSQASSYFPLTWILHVWLQNCPVLQFQKDQQSNVPPKLSVTWRGKTFRELGSVICESGREEPRCIASEAPRLHSCTRISCDLIHLQGLDLV